MTYTDDLILFSQVIELGSFSKAAQANELTSSVVSKRISRLENQLNAQLLYRSTRKLALTEAGKKLAANASAIRQLSQEAVNEIVNDNDKLSGHIKMSVPTISGDLLLADAVAEFCAKHPNLSVDMSLDNRFVDPIEEGIDLIIRTGHLEDSSLIARFIIDSEWLVCCHPSFFKGQVLPTHPRELSKYNCLSYAHRAIEGKNWQFKDADVQYNVKINGAFSTDNAAALRKAALSGHGIIYVPRCLVHEDLQGGKLLSLFDAEVAKTIGVYAIHPFTKKTPKKISLLVDHLRDAYLKKAAYFTNTQI